MSITKSQPILAKVLQRAELCSETLERLWSAVDQCTGDYVMVGRFGSWYVRIIVVYIVTYGSKIVLLPSKWLYLVNFWTFLPIVIFRVTKQRTPTFQPGTLYMRPTCSSNPIEVIRIIILSN